jgi:hypothetical protein
VDGDPGCLAVDELAFPGVQSRPHVESDGADGLEDRAGALNGAGVTCTASGSSADWLSD